MKGTLFQCNSHVVIAWGDFMVYGNGKMSFDYIMPIEDLGIPMGYKYTIKDKEYAVKHSSDWKMIRREKDYNKNIRSSAAAKKGLPRYEDYFKVPRPKTAVAGKKGNEGKENEFQRDVRGMISQLEKQTRSEKRPCDPEVIAEAKKALMTIAGISDFE